MYKSLKFIVLGDRCVGKTTFCLATSCRHPSRENIPYDFGVIDAFCVLRGCHYNICVWDMPSGELYVRFRHISYSNVDAFIICYAIDNLQSFNNAVNYLEDVRDYEKGNILVGLRADKKLDYGLEQEVTYEMGLDLKVRQDFHAFVECSSYDRFNVDSVMRAGVRTTHVFRHIEAQKTWICRFLGPLKHINKNIENYFIIRAASLRAKDARERNERVEIRRRERDIKDRLALIERDNYKKEQMLLELVEHEEDADSTA